MTDRTRAGHTVDSSLRRLILQCQAAPRGSETRRAIFDDIFALTHRHVWMVLKPGLDNAACQDLRQDVYFKIYRSLDEVDVRGVPPRAWICTVARNAKRDRWRAARAQYRHSVVAFAGGDHADRHPAAEIRSTALLEDAFASLSPNEALVLDVYYSAAASRAEAAQYLGWSERKLKKTVEGLRRKLLRQPGVAAFIGAGAKGVARLKPGD